MRASRARSSELRESRVDPQRAPATLVAFLPRFPAQLPSRCAMRLSRFPTPPSAPSFPHPEAARRQSPPASGLGQRVELFQRGPTNVYDRAASHLAAQRSTVVRDTEAV